MYTKDKSNRLTLRLSDEQFAYVRESAEMLGVSPSEFLRMVVNLTMTADKKTASRMKARMQEVEEESIKKAMQEGGRRENEETDKHSIV